jgi:hypothetical protein
MGAVGSAVGSALGSVGSAVGGAVTGLAGTAISAYGAYQGYQAQARADDYNAQIAAQNERFAQMYAQDAIARGAQEEEAHRRKVAATLGSQRAAMGASGTQVNTGTNLDLLTDTVELGELDALIIRDNARREARDYEIQGWNYGAQSELSRLSASSARSAAPLGAAGTLLGGASSTLFRYDAAKRGAR